MSDTGSVPNVRPARPETSVPGVAPPPIAGAATVAPFSWVGSPWDIAGTCVRNAVLAILTLGVYAFWGRTEIRRRMWSSVRLYGEPLAYHGTPQELLRGFLAILAVVLAPLFLIGIVVVVFYGEASSAFGFYQIGLFLVIYPILAAVAFYRARRYRLSRTSWRGLRGSLTGSSMGYAAFSWMTMLAYPLTLGWIAPYRAVELQRAVVNDTTLGDAPLKFEGKASPMYRRYALLWFGTIVLYFAVFGAIAALIGTRIDPQNPASFARLTMRDALKVIAAVLSAIVIWSLMSSFYYARLYNYLAQSTQIGATTARFHLDVTGKRIIWLFVTNTLITYLSLYVLKPVATARAMKYYAEHLSIVGPFVPEHLGQNRHVVDPAGEGLAQAFDLDAF